MSRVNSLEICPEIERIVVPHRKIAARVGELADRIAETCTGEKLTVLAVLSGSMIFAADLVRCLRLPVRIEAVSVCSYPDGATESCGPRIELSPRAGLAGRDVLIVDDILDSGRTLRALSRAVKATGPASIKTCVLLRKVRPGINDTVQPDFVGFEVADEFVVGYGMDFNNLYRNLPDICVLARHAQSRGAHTEPGGAAT